MWMVLMLLPVTKGFDSYQVERLLSTEQKETNYRSADDGIIPNHRPTSACACDHSISLSTSHCCNSASRKKRKGRGKTTRLSTQKKCEENDNGKLKVIIPLDRTVAVGPGAKDFVTELSVKVLHNARHDVKNWKGVPDLAKDRIVAHMLKFHLN